jgi:superfamily II DNA or RNA helicase
VSGLVSMITGSGKSLIFLKTLDKCFAKKSKKGSVYILTCPRIDIIRSLFFKCDKEGKYKLNKKRFKQWKNNKIINLDNINIIDGVNVSAKKVEFDKTKCNLLLINNDSLKVLYKIKKQKKYINNNTNLVIIDECHCLSAIKFYEMIKEMKYDHEIPILGFSATAIRDTKQSEKRVLDILSKSFDEDDHDKKINMIYSYDLLQGIKDEIVLPYRIECVLINEIKGHKIGLSNKKILNGILKKLIDIKSKKLSYKKFVIWTNKKDIMKECYVHIEKEFPQLKVYCTSSFDKSLASEGFNTNYEEYYQSKGGSVLICINKCKEGSDIPYVDCGIYFDGVKNRSILVHIQTSGRLIRPDVEGKKTHGDLIDTFILEENECPHTLTAQKILSYLARLLNLSDDDYSDQIEYYNQMATLANNMEYNNSEQTLKIKIDGNSKHDTIIELKKMKILQMDWTTIKKELDKQVDKKFCISDDEKERMLFNDLKIKSKTEYIEMARDKENMLIRNPHEKFKILWKGWYDFLDVNTELFPPTKEKWLRICKHKNITCKKDYNKCYKKYNLPELPQELYVFDDFDNELNQKNVKNQRRHF